MFVQTGPCALLGMRGVLPENKNLGWVVPDVELGQLRKGLFSTGTSYCF